ncbi:MAG: hypothetical protein HGB12_09245, partial [Bacteroidetes bacterium]|nr:hypothetical protein [Bacteroidota bacterium]
DGSTFQKVKVDLGADFAMQFQSLKHHADSTLIPLGSNFNLPAANLNLNADLAPGIKVNLVTYLSARHHNESWVKGGYLIIDELPFLHSSIADKIMKNFTLKVGVCEINYGDAHFYRSDNARVMNNPFVGNFILDGFTTAPAAELYFRRNGILAMAAVSTGMLKPALGGYNSTTKSWNSFNADQEIAYYFKLGYDKKINENIFIRPTVSAYINPSTHGGTLYGGDRAGSRYFLVMNKKSLGTTTAYDITANVTNGYFGPGSFTKNTSVMGNIYAWLYNFEIFGSFEAANGETGFAYTKANGDVIPAKKYSFNSMALQGLYYFGKDKQFDIGARYNIVSKAATDEVKVGSSVIFAAADKMSTNRIQLGAGWKMTPNIYTKAEYVKQSYSNFNNYGLGSAGFEGYMIEAAISF